jgi:hypothetical protein
VRWWTEQIQQPKHVVLTIRNVPDLTGDHVDELRKWWNQLRRRKFAKGWRGGFYTIQTTNKGKGWHPHIHALIDARFIDESELSKQWLAVTRGAGYNVRVRDARQEDYLREVTRYAVHGAQLAAWTPDQIATFVRAFTGKRTFGVFGSLYAVRTQ